MSTLSQYDPPARQVDFPADPTRQARLAAQWSANVARWVTSALTGDVWDLENYGPRPNFYDPLVTDTPADATNAPITWNAFPGRISALFPDAPDQWLAWGDNGGLPEITSNLCGPIPQQAYTPTGPRGWQDEYCEWCVERDAKGNIVRVSFTCENPEYWLTLWAADDDPDPEQRRVLALYRQLVNPAVQLEDLYLRDAAGQPVIDPATGRPAYDPLNKWNSGTLAAADHGGAVHLTSSPNTLGAEFDLAAAGTMLRVQNGAPVFDPAQLVCCAKYGRAGRHSDPTIGQTVNVTVNKTLPGAIATLTNPPGLYMQTPDFSGYVTPDGADASEFWSVVRGTTKSGPNDIDRILHATFAVPAGKGYTVSDILIDGQNVAYAGQIVQTITMALMATAYVPAGAQPQAGCGCTTTRADAQVLPAVSAIQDRGLFTAYRDREAAAGEIPFSIPILAFPVAPGTTSAPALFAVSVDPTAATYEVVVDGEGVTVAITGPDTVAGQPVLVGTITAAADAPLGDRGVYLVVQGGTPSGPAAAGLLTVASGVSAPPVVAPAYATAAFAPAAFTSVRPRTAARR